MISLRKSSMVYWRQPTDRSQGFFIVVDVWWVRGFIQDSLRPKIGTLPMKKILYHWFTHYPIDILIYPFIIDTIRYNLRHDHHWSWWFNQWTPSFSSSRPAMSHRQASKRLFISPKCQVAAVASGDGDGGASAFQTMRVPSSSDLELKQWSRCSNGDYSTSSYKCT